MEHTIKSLLGQPAMECQSWFIEVFNHCIYCDAPPWMISVTCLKNKKSFYWMLLHDNSTDQIPEEPT